MFHANIKTHHIGGYLYWLGRGSLLKTLDNGEDFNAEEVRKLLDENVNPTQSNNTPLPEDEVA